jgi:hypothetical protein
LQSQTKCKFPIKKSALGFKKAYGRDILNGYDILMVVLVRKQLSHFSFNKAGFSKKNGLMSSLWQNFKVSFGANSVLTMQIWRICTFFGFSPMQNKKWRKIRFYVANLSRINSNK